MEFNGFKIVAPPSIIDAFCDCGNSLKEVSNGATSKALFCGKCNSVYILKLIKVGKIDVDYIKQCQKEIANK